MKVTPNKVCETKRKARPALEHFQDTGISTGERFPKAKTLLVELPRTL